MNSLLASMTVSQAREWEVFDSENPIPEEQLMLQIANIAQVFANYFIKRKDKKGWTLKDFIPTFHKKSSKLKKPAKGGNSVQNIRDQIAGIYRGTKNKKLGKWAEKHSKGVNKDMVIGTNGKIYNKAIDEFIPIRITPPKRLQKLVKSNNSVKGEK